MAKALVSVLIGLSLGSMAFPQSPASDCSILGCAWAGGLCLDVGSACDTTSCRDAYKAAFALRHCNKTEGVVTANDMRSHDDSGKDPCVTGTAVKIGSSQYKSKVLIIKTAPEAAPAVDKPNTKVSATVVGKLQSDGSTFWKSNGDFDYVYGQTPRHLIVGFDVGSYGMKQGESRMICIPPEEGYGPVGRPGIPKNSTLIFTLGCDKVA